MQAGQRLFKRPGQTLLKHLCRCYTLMLKVSSRIPLPSAGIAAAPRATHRQRLRRLGPITSGESPVPRGFGAFSSSITGSLITSTWDQTPVRTTCQTSRPSFSVDLPELLPSSPQLPSATVKAKWNAVSLAFLGDSVWEVHMHRSGCQSKVPLCYMV